MRVVMSGEFWVDVLKLHRLCAAAPDVREVLTADDTDEMCALAGESRDPVVSIIGAEWWARSGTALLRRLATAGGAKGGLVVVAPAPSATVVADALLQGVRGWVLTQSPAEELVTAMRAVAAGHHYVPPALLAELADTMLMLSCQDRLTVRGDDLTSRELDVLGRLVLGSSNAEIATHLFISETTVHSHVLNILRKLNVRNRTEAVATVYRRGLLPDRRAVTV